VRVTSVDGDTPTASGVGFTTLRLAEEGAVESLHAAAVRTIAAIVAMDREDLGMRDSSEARGLHCETPAHQRRKTPDNEN